MNTRKLLAMLLASALALVPMVALAEAEPPEPSRGSFALRLSDPVISMTDDAETTTQDLTGLGVQLGGVIDESGAQGASLLVNLMLLANDEPVVSGMAGMADDRLFVLASGISYALMGTLEAWETLLGGELGATSRQFTDALQLGGGYARAMDGVEFTEGPPERVEFFGGTGECPRHSATLTHAQLVEILGGYGAAMPEDLSVDVRYFTDGGANLRVEGTIHNIDDGIPAGKRDLDWIIVTERLDDGAVNLGGYLGSGAEEVDFDFNGKPDADYPEHYTFEGTIDVAGEDGRGQIQLSLVPGEAEDGTVADVFNATLFDGGKVAGTLDCVFSRGDARESYWLALSDADDAINLGLGYDGTVEANGEDRVHSGVVQIDVRGEEELFAKFNLSLSLSGDVADKIPDIGSMPVIDVGSITDEQLETLQADGSALLINTLGKLMAVPSLAALISSAMQSGATGF